MSLPVSRTRAHDGPDPASGLDWRRLRAVVLESDDWGLCGWAPDEQAYRVLADTPAWRSPIGLAHGRSTLESAADVERLASTLLEFRGADGFPPVWQANTVVAAPDYARLEPPLFEIESLPLVVLPGAPSRWTRPGLWEEVARARAAGVWWNELRGLHRIPAHAWLTALRRGAADARRAHEHQCFVCEATLGRGEYDASEPREVRAADLEAAVERFCERFETAPASLAPGGDRWDTTLEEDASRVGLDVIQGARRGARPGGPLEVAGRRVRMPARIPFESGGGAGSRRVRGTVAEAHRAARAAWARGAPATIDVHRSHFASLDPARAEVGRAVLRDLLARLAGDGALFLTDAEVASLARRGCSVRPIGGRGVLLRLYGAIDGAVRFAVPDGVVHAFVKDARGDDNARVSVEEGELVAQLSPGEYLLEWKRAEGRKRGGEGRTVEGEGRKAA